MSKRNVNKREPELTTAQLQDLINLAERTRESMSTMDGPNQALMLLRTFNTADRVYGLWPDPSRPCGYAYKILKGELGSAAMKRVARNAEISVAGVFQESEDHAELTREIYVGLETSADAFPQTYAQAFNLWLDIVPAHFEDTKARIRVLLG